MRGLTDKVALVTGGASGLGLAMAERLRDEGARVVITDIQEDLGLGVAAERGLTFLRQDVTDEAEWDEVIGRVVADLGGLHVLVNNAGILSPAGADLAGSRLEDWQRIFAVNVEGVFLGCRAGVPAIAESGGGSIVNTSSVAGLIATPFALAYGAGKAAVRHLTTSVAQYCAEHRIPVRCNSIHPGMIRTPAWERGQERKAAERGVPVEAIIAELAEAVPIGELTLAEDIAAAVAFLASDDARHVTGEQLVVDGGLVHASTYFNTTLTGRR
jgi:NAD(P)-dependent dehydrogenase (short-subunit alcohol dehydrogenase family)